MQNFISEQTFDLSKVINENTRYGHTYVSRLEYRDALLFALNLP